MEVAMCCEYDKINKTLQYQLKYNNQKMMKLTEVFWFNNNYNIDNNNTTTKDNCVELVGFSQQCYQSYKDTYNWDPQQQLQ